MANSTSSDASSTSPSGSTSNTSIAPPPQSKPALSSSAASSQPQPRMVVRSEAEKPSSFGTTLINAYDDLSAKIQGNPRVVPRPSLHNQVEPPLLEKLTGQETQYRRLLEKEKEYCKKTDAGPDRTDVSITTPASSSIPHFQQRQADEQLRIAAVRALHDCGVVCVDNASPDVLWGKMISYSGRLTDEAWLKIVHSLTRLKTLGIDVNAKNGDGHTALYLAALKGHSAVVSSLICTPAIDVNSCNNSGTTALHWAAAHGHSAVVSLLLSNSGINANSKNNYGTTALHWAADYGHCEIVSLLLNVSCVDVNAKDNDNCTALYLAVIKDQPAVVKLLLNAPGIDVNIKCNGYTALNQAAVRGHFSIVHLLVSAPGIDINTKNQDGKTMIDWVARNGYHELVRPFLAVGALCPSLQAAGEVNDYIALRREVAMGHDPHTLLHGALPVPASSTGELQHFALGVVQQALLAGEYENASVAHLLATVAQKCHSSSRLIATLALAKILGHYQRKAREAAIDDAIRTMLTQLGQWNAFQFFQGQFNTVQVHINRYLSDGSTLLTRAAKAGDLPMIKVLVQLGADLRLPDQHGDTALAAAAKTGQWPACAELLSLKANPNTSDADGFPAIFYIAHAFATSSGETPENHALAHLIRYVRVLGYHFDRAVANPDSGTAVQQPWINVADLLVCNPGQFGLYAPIIFGTNQSSADRASSAAAASAISSTSSSTTSRRSQ